MRLPQLIRRFHPIFKQIMYRFFRPFLFLLPPEAAHEAAIFALKNRLIPSQHYHHPDAAMLQQDLWQKSWSNPVGMAAGFDKNAEVIAALAGQGFGFVEAGTVTPKAQPGNPKPRIFRLTKDAAIINALGFNNKGLGCYSERMKSWSDRHESIQSVRLGANIGKNKTSEDAVADYVEAMRAVYGLSDYITVNISSPNTPNLRALQQSGAIETLLGALRDTRRQLTEAGADSIPLLIKIAPDLEPHACEHIVQMAMEYEMDGLIVSNTTIHERESLQTKHDPRHIGGLSGKPLMQRSTQMLRHCHAITNGALPLIGVGGISSGDDAYAKIRAGASLVQVYTAIIYQGFGLIHQINDRLITLLKRDGYEHISQAIGQDAR